MALSLLLDVSRSHVLLVWALLFSIWFEIFEYLLLSSIGWWHGLRPLILSLSFFLFLSIGCCFAQTCRRKVTSYSNIWTQRSSSWWIDLASTSSAQTGTATWALCTLAYLVLKLLLLFLLQHQLLLIELLNRLRVDIRIEVRTVKHWRLSSLLDPKVLWRLEIIPKDRNNLLNLIVRVLIDEEVELSDKDACRRLACAWKGSLHGLSKRLVLLLALE